MTTPGTQKEVDHSRMWAIARYVESRPHDYPQRWRLAKKLYAAWEYELALEHLQILKRDWQRRVNVLRYLAATYYRLGRYEDAIRELNEALETWPKDVGLREQLARVLEVAGKPEEAAATWETLQDLHKNHPLADSAARRLRQSIEAGTAPQEPRIGDSESGIELTMGQICQHCGAQNSDGFERCWQCHAVLDEGATSTRSTSKPERRGHTVFGLAPETFNLTAGLTVLGLLTVCLYLGLRLVLDWREHGGAAVASSLEDFYVRQLGLSRSVTGLVVIVLWPFMLSLAMYFVPPKKTVRGSFLRLSGLFLGGVAFLCTWLPGQLLFLAPLIPAGLALLIMFKVFRLPAPQAFGIWALHLVFIGVAGLATFTALEHAQTGVVFQPLRDLAAVLRHGQEPARPEIRALAFSPRMAPFREDNIVWQSTGSPWLDHRAGYVLFTVSVAQAAPQLKFEIQDPSGTRVYEDITAQNWTKQFRVTPGAPHSVLVTGDEEAPVTLTAHGFLRAVHPDNP